MQTPNDNLKKATAKGMLWGGLSNGVCQLMNLFFGLFLARILTSDDYGPIGMLAIFSAVAGSLQESGFVAALANRKQVEPKEYNAVFWFNLLISILIYAVLYMLAPLIALYFREPILIPLSRYSFLGFVAASLGIAPSAFLYRELKVKERSIAMVLAILVSGSVGVIMAVNGYSYWGIATQGILYVSVRSLCYWYYSAWHPNFKIDFSPLRPLFMFSSKLLVTNIFMRINCNIFSFVLGGNGLYSRSDVGSYTKANDWSLMGSETINGMINGVAQPVLARVINDKERQLRVFRRMLRFTACISFPLLFGLSLIAPQLIVITVTEKWLFSAQLLQVLAIWGAFVPLQSMCTQLLISRGKSRIYMWATIFQGVILLPLLYLMHPYGIVPMIISYVVLNILWQGVWQHYVKREIGLSFFMYMRDILPFLVLSSLAILAAYLITVSISNIYLLLLSRLFIPASIYFVVLYVTNTPELHEVLDYLLKRKKKNINP